MSELFRNYVVCFVGYSINDPVLRYMMDALAVDRMLGEVTPQAWALGDCEPGQEHRKTIEWEAKGVTPILYEVPAGSHDHSALYQTLHAWADTYCDDIQGKERIVDNYALKNPSDSTPQNNFVGRMLWALSDKSGLPAKRFADFNPAPSLDWLLEAFSDEHFQHSDLVRWLRRYLNDPRLIIWIAQREGPLPSQWVLKTREALHDFASLERDGKTAVLDKIRSRSPKAIPGPLMRTLWRLLLSGRVKSSGRDSYSYSDLCLVLDRWKEDLKQEGVTATLRWKLREMLAPQVVLKKPFFRDNEAENIDEPTQISQLMDWELALTTDHLYLALHEIADEHWTSALPLLLEDFQQLLRDALDLLRELGEADDRKDQSYIALPAINSDQQDPDFSGWVFLIKLLRDAWLAVLDVDSARATRIAQSWFELPYPTFKRLALFAASQDGCIAPEQWVEWLLADDSWWLWPMETGREVSRLLVRQGRQLTPASQARLEKAILRGPPRRKCRDDLDPDKELIAYLVGYPIKLNLAALEKSGLVLNAAAQTRLAELSTVYAKPGDYEELWESILPPRTRRDLVPWLKKSLRFPSYSEDALREFAQGSTNLLPSYEEGWREVCRNRFFHSLFALCDLARDGVWPTERWHEALHAWTWSEEDMLQRSWCYAAPLVQRMPDTVIQEIAHGVTRWIETVSGTINRHEDILLDLCRRVLEMSLEAGTGMTHNGGATDQPVAEALNHPIWHVTQALINLWFNRNPNDNDLLPEEIKPFFTELCDVQKARFRPGRVLLGSQLITFFRVDRAWTEQYLLPLFNWDNPTEAKAVWEGFLRSPRLYQPLLTALKAPFLESAEHYTDLGGRYKQQFAAFLTYAALEPTGGYTMDEFRSAMGALPQDGIEESAQALFQALEGSADQREDYWRNRVQPFWQQAWPKSRDLVTPRLAKRLTLMSIAARGEFPAALAAVKDWLQPLEHPHYVVDMLHKS
ncbi:SIR2 family protein, partial [Thiolapillus sp.]|uniref:SIR2 family protein n=1 Tax=Thiolapillus sp. TaxID=2017437 RepID=UPI003AF8E99B